MKIYEMVVDDTAENHGIDAISLVEKPAIEIDFVSLAEDVPVQLAVDEKRMVIGAALVPDKPIYRNRDGMEFYIYFSKSTIAQLQEKFFRNSNHHNATLQHSEPVNGVYVVESWIVEDPERDKSQVYGLSVPRGTWMVAMKIDNEELWEDHVKTGKVKGFSIEGFFTDAARLKEKQNMSEEQRLIAEIEFVCKV